MPESRYVARLCASFFLFFFFCAVGIGSPGTPSRLMQPARVFKGCWVPSPALSGSHKGFIKCRVGRPDAGGLWKWVPSSAPSCVACVCVWCCRRACPCLRLLITCVRRLRCGCMHVFSSHSGTLPPQQPLLRGVPASQLRDNTIWSRCRGRKNWAKDEGEYWGGGQRPVNKRREEKKKWRRVTKSVALNLVPGVCALQTAKEQHSKSLGHASADRCCYVQTTFIYWLIFFFLTHSLCKSLKVDCPSERDQLWPIS